MGLDNLTIEKGYATLNWENLRGKQYNLGFDVNKLIVDLSMIIIREYVKENGRIPIKYSFFKLLEEKYPDYALQSHIVPDCMEKLIDHLVEEMLEKLNGRTGNPSTVSGETPKTVRLLSEQG